MSLGVGARLGHYSVTAKLGEGGMGEAYLERFNPHAPATTMIKEDADDGSVRTGETRTEILS